MAGSSALSNSVDQRESALLEIYWIQFIVTFVLVILRFYTRFSISAIGLDDYAMAVTMLLNTASTVIMTILVRNNGLNYITQETVDQRILAITLFFILQPISSLAVAIGRTSVAILLLRLVGRNTWTKILLYFSIISTLALSVVYSIMLFLRCGPIASAWESVLGVCPTEDLVPILAVVLASWNGFMDICLALIPMVVFSKLHMNTKKKTGLCILMSLGMFASIAAAIKAWKYTFLEIDFTYQLFNVYCWSGVELFLVMVCACVPTLKPLYDRYDNQRTCLPTFKSLRDRYSKRPSTYTSNSNAFPKVGPYYRSFDGDFEILNNTPGTHFDPTHQRAPPCHLASGDQYGVELTPIQR